MSRQELPQEWKERLEDFSLSEMTVQQWCDFNALPVHQYQYWRRRLAAPKTAPHDNANWMALSVVETLPFPTMSAITLRIAGAQIEVTPGFDPGLLRAVVDALATNAC